MEGGHQHNFFATLSRIAYHTMANGNSEPESVRVAAEDDREFGAA